MHTMRVTTSNTNVLHYLFPNGFTVDGDDDAWLGAGRIHSMTFHPAASATGLLPYDIYDGILEASGRPVQHGTTFERFHIDPGGTVTGTQGDNNPEAHTATLSLTGWRHAFGGLVPVSATDVITVPMDIICNAGILIAVTPPSAHAWTIDIVYTPYTTGGARYRAAQNPTMLFSGSF